MKNIKFFDNLFNKENHYKISDEEQQKRIDAKLARKNTRCKAIIDDLDNNRINVSSEVKKLYKEYLQQLMATDRLSILISSFDEDNIIFSAYLKYTQLNIQLVTILTDKKLNGNTYNHIDNQSQIANLIYELTEKEKEKKKVI